MVSLDIVSLFTNVPTGETIEIILKGTPLNSPLKTNRTTNFRSWIHASEGMKTDTQQQYTVKRHSLAFILIGRA